MKPKFALYCRPSPSDPAGQQQEQALRQAVARAGGEIAGVWHSGVVEPQQHCPVRQAVLDLARSGEIEAVWVTALTRWSRSLRDLADTLSDLHACRVALMVPEGPCFEPVSPQQEMMLTLVATLATFEHDLRSEWVRFGIEAARARGRKPGRRVGQLIKTQDLAPEVMARVAAGQTYVQIAQALNLNKNTITAIVRRHRKSSG